MLWPRGVPIIDVTEEWVFYPLPHQTALIEALRKNKTRQFNLRREIRERTMNFQEAVEATKRGSKVRRPEWDTEMWMTWFKSGGEKGYLVHTHPYWEHQEAATPRGEYVYVTENDDALASDWEMVCA